MCGILGGNNLAWNYLKGIECMKHRGPDGTRISRLEGFTLGFTRLAIIDLSDHGMQPMFSEDKKVCIVFNGEIYGYQKLRNALKKRGYRFRSTTDTEVVLNAYLAWGERFITKIDGMFGMAIYDGRDGKIRIFRDRVGIKPLYYYFDGKNFGFASELKGIINMCNTVCFDIDQTAIYDYINYLYIPDPKTYYKNVYKLLPGHFITFDIFNRRIINNLSYWRLKINGTQGTQRKKFELIDELKYLIKESIEEQMVADVPVGTFLSGGVDSGIVTYESHKVNSQLESFSIGFDDAQYSELEHAYDLAERIKVHLNTEIFNRSIFRQLYKKMKIWYDEPFADTSAFPTYLVSKMAKNKVSVVLTGDGGDEVFGGYERYRDLWKKEKEHGSDHLFVSFIYDKLKKNRAHDYYWLDDLTLLFRSYGWPAKMADKDLRNLLNIDKDYDRFWLMRKYYFKDLPPITRVQYLDFKTYLPGDILTKVDRTSMAVSLEVRVPLLARRLIEFSFSLSEQDRCPNGELKGLLKKAFDEEIGKRILYRSKMGFNIPENYFGSRKSPQEYLLKDIWNG